MRKLLLLIPFACMCILGFGQASKNLTLLGHLTTPSDLNDVWGYADGTGKEYALVGIQSGGIGIVDVSTPASPTLLQTIPGIPSLWRDLKTFSHYGYVVNDNDQNQGGAGLLIVDLSSLPGTCAYKDTVMNGLEYAHNIYVDNGYLYVVGSNVNPGIDVYDLNVDPWRPTLVGSYTTHYVHDLYVRNDTAYAGELEFGLTIIDFTNKAAPVVIGNRPYVGNFTHNTWLSDDGNTCFSTDEIPGGRIISWDVSDPANIEFQDEIRSSLSLGEAIPHNAHVLNDFIITSYYRDGLHIVDATRPNNIIETGYYDTSPLAGDGFDGDWGAYPFLPSGIVLASDLDDGLFVFQPNYVQGCYLEGVVTDSITGAPIVGADINFVSEYIFDQSIALGEYETGVADSGTYAITFSKFGYFDKTINVTLDNGVVVIQNVPMAPRPRTDLTVTVVEAGTGLPIPNAEVNMVEPTLGGNLDFVTDANGQILDPNFVQGTYIITAGIWGHVTKQTTFPAGPTAVNYTMTLDKGYYDDFVLDFGWTVSGNASAGVWERGDPNGTTGFFGFVNPEDDVSGDIGTECYVTGNQGQFTFDDDVDDGITVLTSPTMDLSAMVEPTLDFDYWFVNNSGSGNPNDTLIVQISNGFSSVTMERITGDQNFWAPASVTISNFISPTNFMTVKFICGDFSPGHIVESAVDKFLVWDANSTANEESFENSVNLQAYPNPVVNNARVVYDLGVRPANAKFELRDMLGRTVYQRDLQSQTGTFNVSIDGPSGLYIASLINDGEVVETFKMIK